MCSSGKECNVLHYKTSLSDTFFVDYYLGKYKLYRFILYDVCTFDKLNLR